MCKGVEQCEKGEYKENSVRESALRKWSKKETGCHKRLRWTVQAKSTR